MLKPSKPYKNLLPNPIDNENAIKFIRDTFTDLLFEKLWRLTRTSAPIFIESGQCVNDDLANTATPVSFEMAAGLKVEMIHSLAKWKRLKLKELGMQHHNGVYTNMNAIRKDETLDNLHSVYVDQWDWEMVISAEERSVGYLESRVREIYRCIRETEQQLSAKFPQFTPTLPAEVKIFDSRQLENDYPEMSQKEIENLITKEHGAVFIVGMDRRYGRASDYDDWQLNGDLLIWSHVIDCPIEITSMGVRVDSHSLAAQLKESGEEHKSAFVYHKMILDNELPLSIGGGIGQSRLCMLLLQKGHIGEVQCSVWNKETLDYAAEYGMAILH